MILLYNCLKFTRVQKSQDSFKFPWTFVFSVWRKKPNSEQVGRPRILRSATTLHGVGEEPSSFPPMTSSGSSFIGLIVGQWTSQLQFTSPAPHFIYALTMPWNALALSLLCCLCESILLRSSLSHISALPSWESWLPGCTMSKAEIISHVEKCPEVVKAVKGLSLFCVSSRLRKTFPRNTNPTPFHPFFKSTWPCTSLTLTALYFHASMNQRNREGFRG